MPVSYRCWAEVDLDALRENLSSLRRRIGPGIRIMTVVKADAYGHGLKQIAALLMQSGTDVFGVANLAEAAVIRGVGRGWPVLMLGACLPDEIETAVRDGVMPTVSTLEEAQAFSNAARKWNKPVSLHLKVDTGMGRLGVAPADAPRLLEDIERLAKVRVIGLCTHFASVEGDAEFSERQRETFARLVEQFRAGGREFEYIHANNSGGVFLEPGSVYNTVRPGLAVYGILPPGCRFKESEETAGLRPALSWKCRVSLVREIAPGTSLSYGRTFIADRTMRVATITAGYGDGYLRSGSNRAEVLIGGRRCRVLGRVTMDQMLADVSAVEDVRAGDEVVLIGSQGTEAISAKDVAAWCGTVPWEVLTNITYRVPRVYRGVQAA